MPSMKKSKSGGSVHGEGPRDAAITKANALRQYVQAALTTRVAEAQSPTYNSFVKELQALRRKTEAGAQDDAAAEFGFVALLQALRDCAGFLREGCHDAVLATVLGIGLWRCSPVVREAVLDVIVEIIASSTGLISNCLQVLIFNLLPPPGSPTLQPDVPGTPWEVPPLAEEVQDAIVHAIERSAQCMPVLPARLLSLLLQNMPHKLRDRPSQCLFLRASIALAEGRLGGSLREGLLTGLVEHLLGIDADIRWEDIVDAPTGYDHEESDDGQDEMFDLEGLIDLEIDPASHHQQQQHDLAQLHDGFHDPAAFASARRHLQHQQQALEAAAGGDGLPPGGGGGVDGGKPARLPVDVTADKLDSMMELVLRHLQWRLQEGQLGAVWQTLLRAFEGRLLHAHRCKFTQFLLFYVAAREPERCCGSFAGCLMTTLRDASRPAITRCACAAYLASFLARCAPAPKALVVDVLHKLTAAAQEYADAAMAAARRHQQQQHRSVHRVGSSSGALALKGNGSSSAALVLLAGLNDLMGQGPLNGVAAAGAAAGGAGGGSAGALAAIQRHQVFYAMVQALLYLLCYHMQPLLGELQQAQQAQQQGQQQQQQLGQALAELVKQQVLPLLSHALAPLAVCHQAVTSEFVRQALLLGLADAAWEAAALEAVSEHQAALAIAASASTAVVIGGEGDTGIGGGDNGIGGGALRVLRPLEVFFPFDPYLLRRSARYLDLPRCYTCFSHGHPHAMGARGGRGGGRAGGGGEGAAGASDEEEVERGGDDDTTSDDEGDWEEAAVLGGSSGGGSGSDSDTSSSGSEDEDGGMADAAAAAAPAAAAASGGPRLKRRAASLLPVGLAAIGTGGLSGPSPPPDLMATSLLGGSYGSGGGGVFGGMQGGSPYLGSSPMPMSITPYDGSYMLNLQAQLKQQQAQGAGAGAPQ